MLSQPNTTRAGSSLSANSSVGSTALRAKREGAQHEAMAAQAPERCARATARRPASTRQRQGLGALQRDLPAQHQEMRGEQGQERARREREQQLDAEHARDQTRCAGVHGSTPKSPGSMVWRGGAGGNGTTAGGREGRTMVNVLPFPSWLFRSMKPRCICTKRRVMAKPRPVPMRCRLTSPACQYSWKIASWSSRAMPGPVSVTAIVTPPSRGSMRSVTPPLAGELDGVAHDIAEDLAHPATVGEGHGAIADDADLERLRLGGDARLAYHLLPDRTRRRIILQLRRELAGLERRQIEDVVDQRAQVLTAIAHDRQILLASSLSGPSTSLSSTSVKPKMAFSGVRSSWLRAAKKSLRSRS